MRRRDITISTRRDYDFLIKKKKQEEQTSKKIPSFLREATQGITDEAQLRRSRRPFSWSDEKMAFKSTRTAHGVAHDKRFSSYWQNLHN